MNSTTKSIRRPTITLALPRSVPAPISYAQGVVTRMTGVELRATPQRAGMVRGRGRMLERSPTRPVVTGLPAERRPG